MIVSLDKKRCFMNLRKLSVLTVSIFVLAFSTMQTTSLQAASWGLTEDVTEFEGAKWNEVYLKLNGLNATASIPNYIGATLSNGSVSLTGIIEDVGYLIETQFNTGFTAPDTKKKFILSVQKNNLNNFSVEEVEAEVEGAKYAVDLLPKKDEIKIYWRFVATKDRLIRMGTEDTDEARRLHFFNSLRIE